MSMQLIEETDGHHVKVDWNLAVTRAGCIVKLVRGSDADAESFPDVGVMVEER